MPAPLPPLLRDLAREDLETLVAEAGQPSYRADQLVRWLYPDAVFEWAGMSNLPRAFRERLAAAHDLAGLSRIERQVSRDGTRKFLFELRDGHRIESVIIPMSAHATFCLSSQVGCAMACSFCATARGGLVRNLSPGEILEQALRMAEDLDREPLPSDPGRGWNVVFMGMGEPLDNLGAVTAAVRGFTDPKGLAMSPRRITISTSGHRDGLTGLIDSDLATGLTLSVNTCRPELRRKLMPVPGRTPLPEILDLAERYARTRRTRVTLAYVLIDGVNDDVPEAETLGRLTANRPFKVNLIPLNRIDKRRSPSSAERVLAFQDRLRAAGVEAYIRASGGDDIAAACGQLRESRGRRGRGSTAPRSDP